MHNQNTEKSYGSDLNMQGLNENQTIRQMWSYLLMTKHVQNQIKSNQILFKVGNVHLQEKKKVDN